MPLIIPSNSISAGGYEVDNSLRFDDGSSDYLYRTFTTPTNNKIFTWSGWVKRGSIGTSSSQNFLRTNGATSDGIRFADQSIDGNLDGIRIFFNNSTSGDLNTTQKFRDVSAWYHIVLSVDTTQATASDRVKLYINGEQVTSFNTETYPALNHTPKLNSATQHNIGTHQGNEIFDGYMSEVVFIDGQQLDPTSFGEFDEDSGIWKPIDVSGLTFGTNGFYLDFENSGSLGADVSGNSNNFTVNNLTSIDQTTDTPTNNFATLNPLSTVHTENISSMLSNGNVDYSPSGDYSIVKSNIPFGTTGKWYVEAKINTTPGGSGGLGVQRLPATSYSTNSYLSYQCNDYCYSYQGGGKIAKGSASSTTVASGLEVFTAGDIIAMLFDADNNEIKWYNNDTLIYTLDLSTAPDGYYINDGEWVFAYMGYSGNGTININFGNPTITISSGNSDANGYGNFEYSTKDGYALNTKNLAEYG